MFENNNIGASSIPRAVRSQKPLPIGLSVLAVAGFVYYAKKYVFFPFVQAYKRNHGGKY